MNSPLWKPSPERIERAALTRFRKRIELQTGQSLPTYTDLWRWSVDDLDDFWTSMWELFEVGGRPPGPALAERRMPGARWFPGATRGPRPCCWPPWRVSRVSEEYESLRPGFPRIARSSVSFWREATRKR